MKPGSRIAACALVTALWVGFLIAWAPGAGARGGPTQADEVTINDFLNGETLAVRHGDWLRFRMVWIAADEHIQDNISALSMEVILDGTPLATQASTEDVGELCFWIPGGYYGPTEVCHDADRIVESALAHPLNPGTHSVVLRYSFSEPATDGWFTYTAGYSFEYSGTILVTN